jgi:hypothetical protein
MVGNGLSHMLKVDLVKKNEIEIVATLVKTYCEKMTYEESCKLKLLK